jgi:alpha-mannosidase
VLRDDEDPWGMRVRAFRDEAGGFRLLSRADSARFCGVREPELDPVRVIEDGEVRTVVEANFRYGDSFMLQTYRLPKQGTEIEVEVRLHWNEKDMMLKWAVPTTLEGAAYLGQQAYGVEELYTNGDECVAHQWTAVADRDAGRAFTCANDGVYGSDFLDGVMRLTLMRSPAYCAHPIYDRPLVPQDRYTPRIDQGERLFRFWLNAGPVEERLAAIGREALAHNEEPFALSFFPHGEGEQPAPALTLDDDVILCNALKQAERSEDLIVRLFEPTGSARSTTVRVPAHGIEQEVSFGPFEIKTFRIDGATGRLVPVDLTEADLA